MQSDLKANSQPSWTALEMESLRQHDLRLLLIILAILTWAAGMRFLDTGQNSTAGLFLGLLTTLAVSASARRWSAPLASLTLISGLILAVGAETISFPHGFARLLLAPVLVASGMIVGPALIMLATAGAAAMLLFIEWTQPAAMVGFEALAPALVAVVATGCMAALSARQVQGSVNQAMYFARQAIDALNQSRIERGKLAQVAKALDESQYRLEKANHALTLARAEAEQARQLKIRFANMISHEMRAPLNFVIGATELMANAPETYGPMPWPSGLHEDIQIIHQSCQHLAQLIDDVLALAQIEANRMTLSLERHSLVDIVASVVRMVGPAFAANGLFLDLQAAPDIPAMLLDRIRIRQVLLNLLNNARRFTRTGGVLVRVVRTETEVIVDVEDMGCGIPPEDLPRLFVEFYQLPGAQAKNGGGTGLGLAISKEFVELHGGRIWAESPLRQAQGGAGTGTRFSFALPLSSTAWPTQTMPADDSFWDRLTAEAKGERVVLIHSEHAPLAEALRRGVSGYRLMIPGASDRLAEKVSDLRPHALVNISSHDNAPAVFESWLNSEDIPLIHCHLANAAAGERPLWNGYLLKPVSREKVRACLAALGLRPRQWLIIDDDPRIQRYFELVLRSEGTAIEIRHALSGEEGLASLAQQRPDIALLDLSLPGISGWEVLQRIRGEQALADLPVIVVSGQDSPLLTTACFAGLTLTRQRPFTRQELTDCLQGLLDAVRPGYLWADVEPELRAGLAATPAS